MVTFKHGGCDVDVVLAGEKMEQAECFRYLGTDTHETGRTNAEISYKEKE